MVSSFETLKQRGDNLYFSAMALVHSSSRCWLSDTSFQDKEGIHLAFFSGFHALFIKIKRRDVYSRLVLSLLTFYDVFLRFRGETTYLAVSYCAQLISYNREDRHLDPLCADYTHSYHGERRETSNALGSLSDVEEQHSTLSYLHCFIVLQQHDNRKVDLCSFIQVWCSIA